jgi:acetyl/propionyl-CoA carboxylase alpha subunit/acetyl-CoA carboxylase carboxyltransferase component
MNRFEPIRRLAIVNRGEAAMRCIRAVKALRALEGGDLLAVALYTDVDRDAPFVRHADVALRLPAPRGEVAAYLDHDALVELLLRAGADAVWPGWGFVAEDPVFVERLAAEGIRFLGPPAAAMRRLGDKIGAKRLAEEVGVPVTPWSGRELSDEADASRLAASLGHPVVLKASAGGGGRGIRVVHDPAALAAAFCSARNEALAAFGDGRLFLERQVVGARHVEVQIAADRDGVVVALGCRDCSVQRRHQKLVEEAPPPGLSAERLDELERAAVRLTERVGYEGLGTVEFLVTPEGFDFLEMNPRLQVEHGLTEEITGLDLVQLQIRIARGETLRALSPEARGVAIEARVCAEDPEAGFLPAPGRIARFDPALGPRVRIDAGVAAGSPVPAVFDSLVAKVIATGRTREEARSRLLAALADFDLVIEGGATNKGFLLEILGHPDFAAGGVDSGWLDRFAAARVAGGEHVAEALTAAAILSYQRARAAARLNFYSDPTHVTASRIPASRGQEIALAHGGQTYRLRVFATGAWRYRVHMGGRAVMAALREESSHAARLQVGERTLRVLYDADETGIRVEVEGRSYRFGAQGAGQVRAGAPAMVLQVHVAVGDVVRAGQPLGLLEAMKMEIGFVAPVSGVVTEVRARKGQQVAAGDVLLVVDPSVEPGRPEPAARRIALPEIPDPLEVLFRRAGEQRLRRADLERADRAPAEARRSAIEAVREEVRRVLLGYDANLERAGLLAQFLEAPLPASLSDAFLWELSAIRQELSLLADVTTLFIRWPGATVSGSREPSNHARLRMYVRRIRAGGAGITEEFLDLVRAALRHYGIEGLEPSDALERAVLRLLASQLSPELRDRFALAILRRVAALARAGVHLGDDRDLAATLGRIAGMRGLLSHSVADAAVEAGYVIFEQPEIERQAERISKELQVWIDAAESHPKAPPEDVLCHLADAPRVVFQRIGRWLRDEDPRRRAIARAAYLRRLYSPLVPLSHASFLHDGEWIERLEFEGPRVVLAGSSPPSRLGDAAALLVGAAERERDRHEWPAVHAIELLVPVEGEEDGGSLLVEAARALDGRLSCARLSLGLVREHREEVYRTLVPTPEGFREDAGFHGIHPAAAERIDLARLAAFELERLEGPDGIYCFAGRSRAVAGDERVFVLADLRSRSPDDGREAHLHIPAFEHAFHEATRALRGILNLRDPNRRLQWNRIALFVAPEIFLDRETAEALARRLAPATRHLGLEKVLVRLRLLDRDAPDRPGQKTEIVISDITGSNMTILRREPRRAPLAPRSEYERKVAEARRRRLVYPYEIVRMLTGSAAGAEVRQLPTGRFEEHDLDPESAASLARSVAGRPYGMNACGVVFGVMTTPTEEVPEGLARVLVLSDPTFGMGALAAPECDRIVAALDLAERRGIPLEWVPVSSGARIAMDSGTENLDATARVVRRIVEFTERGGVIHVIVAGVNVGAQSYFDALSTMLMHARGALIMTEGASMVLTGRAALEASGAVSAEDESAIGGFERVMGPNGEAQYYAADLADAYRILYEHYRYTYVPPGERLPRRIPTHDPAARSLTESPVSAAESSEFETVGEIFDDATNPGRKRPFPMRAVMQALIDRDGGHLERWPSWVGAETAIVWDARLGGWPVCLIGIESQIVTREGYRPADGPSSWTGGTLFPLSSKKVARAIRAASGVRPVVLLANLSGFDGSPESMRKLQLEYGAEIARAVVTFDGPILFLVVSRYHGGAYVVFSRALHPRLRAAALTGSFASVIGGGAAATVVFGRQVRAHASADPRLRALREELRQGAGDEVRDHYERLLAEIVLEKQAEAAAEFDAVHTVERARAVGSLEAIVEPREARSYLIGLLDEELRG